MQMQMCMNQIEMYHIVVKGKCNLYNICNLQMHLNLICSDGQLTTTLHWSILVHSCILNLKKVPSFLPNNTMKFSW